MDYGLQISCKEAGGKLGEKKGGGENTKKRKKIEVNGTNIELTLAQ